MLFWISLFRLRFQKHPVLRRNFSKTHKYNSCFHVGHRNRSMFTVVFLNVIGTVFLPRIFSVNPLAVRTFAWNGRQMFNLLTSSLHPFPSTLSDAPKSSNPLTVHPSTWTTAYVLSWSRYRRDSVVSPSIFRTKCPFRFLAFLQQQLQSKYSNWIYPLLDWLS